MSKRMDVLEILIETCQNLLKKLYLGLKEDAEWSKMVWNRSNLVTIPDFRFHLKDRWNLTKNQVNSFENLWIWFEIVQNFKFDFKNRFESDDRVWHGLWFRGSFFEISDQSSSNSKFELIQKCEKCFQSFAQISTLFAFQTFWRLLIAEKYDRNNTCGWAVRKKKVETCSKGSNVLKTCGLCWNVLTVPCFWFDLKKKLILTQNFQFIVCSKIKLIWFETVWFDEVAKNWRKSSRLLVYFWFRMIVNFASLFKFWMKQVVSPSQIWFQNVESCSKFTDSLKFQLVSFFKLFNNSKLLRAEVTAKRPAAWLNMQTDRWYHQPPHLQPERCFFLFLVRT